MPFIRLKQALKESGFSREVRRAIVQEAKDSGLPEDKAGIAAVEKFKKLTADSARNVKKALADEPSQSSQHTRLYKDRKEVKNLR